MTFRSRLPASDEETNWVAAAAMNLRPALAGIACALVATTAAPEEVPLQLVQTIALDGVKGRLDHLAIDPATQRLFVAALGNDTVEVIDLRAGKRSRSVGGFGEPQGVDYSPELHRLFVSSGGSARVDFLDGGTMAVVARAEKLDDADNLRYDAARQRVYVGYGGTFAGVGHAGIRILDAATGRTLGDVPVSAHPESFRIDPVARRLYANVPGAARVAVVDLDGNQVAAQWSLGDASSNFPMALDSTHHRLFVATRSPSRLLVYDVGTGRIVASQDLPDDPDDIFYDAAAASVYVSCGEGLVSVLSQRDPDKYSSIARIPTAPGARTSLFAAETGRLYVAVPARSGRSAEIRVFATRSAGQPSRESHDDPRIP